MDPRATTWSDITARLPDHLSERVRVLRDGIASTPASAEPRSNETHIVCWLHHAVRAHENPGLDVARLLAAELALPLVVYQGLGGRHRFNSDRHHTFIMEGARDLAAELQRLDPNIRFAFNLQHDPASPSPLTDLCRRAAAVVTEDFPAPPFPAWTDRLAERSARPVILVDAACVVPMRLVDGEHLRAFKFRSKTEKLFKQRAGRAWPDIDAPLPTASDIDLGFEPVDWNNADIESLCAACEIDHSIAPVGHTRGGSRAGYDRWEAFKANGLKGYHKRRNRAEIDRDELAVSRMSAYLHHGHVSPFRLVREAWGLLKTGFGDGAEKFIDEIWVWRELAHHLCFRYPHELETSDIIPAWAKQTLAAHKDDPREVKSWESLARARSGHELWDAAQRSLLAHGELHNNVRMTWGKALVGWSDGPRRAQRMLIDLNHRFALDGNNPNSYGGLLWCLGVFDRPFEGVDEPVTGSLRPRPLDEHAGRINLAQYARAMDATSWGDQPRVAVVGAGIAGMAAARTLADQNARVTVFDKGRGPGGRMSTRRSDDLRFDHGAQYFTAKDERFARLVQSWVRDGVAAPWEGRIGQVDRAGHIQEKPKNPGRYVGTPGMNAVVRHLGETLGGHSEVRFGVRVSTVHATDAAWSLTDDQGADLGRFDAAVIALPAPQAADLLGDAPTLREQAAAAPMQPCWAAMASFEHRVPCDFDGLFINIQAGPLSWAARDSSKPGRDNTETWVLHASPEWSAANTDRDKDAIAAELLTAFFDTTGVEPVPPMTLGAHRWLYAQTQSAFGGGCLFDRDRLIAACGDWCHGGRVEGAYLSGVAAAGRVLGEAIRRSRALPPKPSKIVPGETTLFKQ